MKSKKILSWFRVIAIAEGISFILLLGIAMPLKYLYHKPLAVQVAGLTHGLLFICFVILSWETMNVLNKKTGWFAKAFLASVIPFGTFVLDKQLKKETAKNN